MAFKVDGYNVNFKNNTISLKLRKDKINNADLNKIIDDIINNEPKIIEDIIKDTNKVDKYSNIINDEIKEIKEEQEEDEEDDEELIKQLRQHLEDRQQNKPLKIKETNKPKLKNVTLSRNDIINKIKNITGINDNFVIEGIINKIGLIVTKNIKDEARRTGADLSLSKVYRMRKNMNYFNNVIDDIYNNEGAEGLLKLRNKTDL